ncbi:VWA domain-containing protein [Candidatus Omnitrophota bacterium]
MRRVISFLVITLAVLVVCNSAWARVKVYTDVDKPVVLAGDDSTIVVKVGLSGDDVPRPKKRLLFNIAVVLDKSGSMRSRRKIENAKQGAIEIVDRLTCDDIFSFIVYGTQPQVLIPAQRVTNKDALIDVIQSISADGSTALYDGVVFGAAEVRKHASEEHINRIVLLSDGLANVGPQSTDDLAELGMSLSDEGIIVSTIGVGLDYNEDLMTALAASGDGNAYFAANSDELPDIFTEEIGEAMTLLARDIAINVDCPDKVTPIRVLGRRGVITDTDMELTIGHLYGKNEKFALFEIQVPAMKAGKNITVARVNIKYSDPYSKNIVTDHQTLSIAYHKDQGFVERKQNKQIIKEAALNRAAEVKRRAIALSDKGDFLSASRLMKSNSSTLEKVALQCDNDTELLGEAKQFGLYGTSVMMQEGFSKRQRKGMMNQQHTTTNQQSFISRGGSVQTEDIQQEKRKGLMQRLFSR